MRIGSWSLLILGGRPRTTGLVFQGSHFMASMSSLSQRRSSTRRLRALLRTTPLGVPMRCSSVFESLPSQIPSSQDVSSLLSNAPGLLHATASPGIKMTLL